jgi:hypothetical protein
MSDRVIKESEVHEERSRSVEARKVWGAPFEGGPGYRTNAKQERDGGK